MTGMNANLNQTSSDLAITHTPGSITSSNKITWTSLGPGLNKRSLIPIFCTLSGEKKKTKLNYLQVLQKPAQMDTHTHTPTSLYYTHLLCPDEDQHHVNAISNAQPTNHKHTPILEPQSVL